MAGAADDFACGLAEELGADGWFEHEYDRDIWYATVVHFTGPIDDPAALVDWVATRRRLDLGVATVGEAELSMLRFDGRQPVREPLARAALGAARAPS